MDHVNYTIKLYSGDLYDLLNLFTLSTGLTSADGIRHLIDIEKARGTAYYVAVENDVVIGMIGIFQDPTGRINEIEPPQIIDLAVLPDYQHKGVAHALVNIAENNVRDAGHTRIWLYTDGNSASLPTFYRKLGYRLVSVIPDWFGERTCKAYFRKDL